MGIGFDVFKANLGWNLADSAMSAVSNAIEKKAQENAVREKAEKAQSDKNDMLKTLVFMLGNNISLDRKGKKLIASVLSTVYEEDISLFSIEDKIDTLHTELKSQNLKQFFANIAAINTDRQQVCAIYIVAMLLYMNLSDEQMALPVHVYNLALIKKFFAINRGELAQCYSTLGEELDKDTDDIADVFEDLTSEEAIKKIEAENPTLVYDDNKNFIQKEEICENPKEEIEKCYNAIVQGSEKSFTDRFFLADLNPKKAMVAINAYAKNCKNEEIIALYDDSAFCNGKVGFLLSNKKLYVCNTLEKPKEIELSAISNVITGAKVITVNDINIDTTMVNKTGIDLICEFLQKVIPLAMKIQIVQ